MKLLFLFTTCILSFNIFGNTFDYSRADSFLEIEKNLPSETEYKAINIPNDLLPDLAAIAIRYTSKKETCGTFKAYNDYVDAYIREWDFFNDLRMIEKTKLNNSNFLDSHMRLEVTFSLRILNSKIDFLEFDREKLKKRQNMYCSRK